MGISGKLVKLSLVGAAILLLVYGTSWVTSSLKSLRPDKRVAQKSKKIPESTPAELLIESEKLRASADIDWSILYSASEEQRKVISAAIYEASKTYGVSADLLRAIIMAESLFNDKANSDKGAKGLMQLMPHTAQDMGVSHPFNPRENILGGAQYLASLIKQFKGDIRLAVAAFNIGPKALRNSRGQIPYTVLPYVNRVMSYYKFFKGNSEAAAKSK